MKISKVEVIQIETPRYYQTLSGYSGTISGHVIFKVHTDDGPVGLGEASDSRADDVAAIAARCNELLRGRDATCITEINELMRARQFNSTVSDAHLASAIDIALYDLNAKARNVPAFQLMGGKLRDRLYCCYPIFGTQVAGDFEESAGFLQRVVDLGHHLFRYYVSGDSELDNRFLTEMKSRFGDRIRLKSIDMSLLFDAWDTALRYAEVLRHHDPFHFEHPSRSMRVNAEFTRRWDLPLSLHIDTLEQAREAVELGAGTAFNIACVSSGPTYIRRIAAVAEAAGFRCLIGTDQESTIGTAAQVAVGITLPNLSLPCDPMGPVLYMESPAKERIRAEASHLYPFEGPGWGVELDDEKLRRLTVAAA